MKMRDKRGNVLEEGQEVQFHLNQSRWKGIVLEVDHTEEQIIIEVTERTTGVGLRERMNHIECSRYITIIASEKKYEKDEAIHAAGKFLEKVRELEKQHGFSLNSDTGDIYLTYKKKSPKEGENIWDNVKIGWRGDGSGIRVTELTSAEQEEQEVEEALAKLSDREKKLLGLAYGS